MRKLIYSHIENNGVRIQYYRTGEEKPALIFLHGATDYALCWNQLPLNYEPEFDVILMDARGHGLSGAPESGYTPQDQAGDVAALIRQLGLTQTVLLGHSMGADTAAATAALYPDLVGALVLEDPPWPYSRWGATPAERQENAARMREQILAYKSMTFDEIVAFGKEKYPRWDSSEYFQWAKSKQMVSLNMVSNLLEERTPWEQVLQSIRCPGLVFSADPAQGAILTPDTVARIQELWKGVEVVHIPDAGHNIHREQYRTFRDEVKRYLRELQRPKKRLRFPW